MITLIQDLRYALRQLGRTPGFTVTVLLTLALGIGANAAIFTLINSVLLKNLPVADPARLVRLGDDNDCCVNGGSKARETGDYTLFSTDSYEQLKKDMPEFEDLAAMQAGFGYRPVVVRREGAETAAQSVMGEFVSGNYFRTFGLRPEAGRLLMDGDDVTGAPATAVMSYAAWQHDFAADPAVVGSTFYVNTKPVTVVGIAPRGFYGDRMAANPPVLYLPIEAMPVLANAPYVHDRGQHWLYLMGRVKPGVAMGPLQARLSQTLRQIVSADPNYSGDRGKVLLARAHIALTPGGAGINDMRKQYAGDLKMLMGIAGLVLLIACANVANLLLVRGMGRRVEMSVRTALGATRMRVVRQLLTESVLLAGLGGLAGLAVAYGGARGLLMLAFPWSHGVTIDASPSAGVIAFAFGLALVTGVLFGIAPAWMAAQARPADALRSSTRTTAVGASYLQRGLVVLQAALSLVLLVGAGLFSQSLHKLESTDMKLDATNRYIVHINPQAAGYAESQVGDLYRTIEDRFHAIPGVVKVGISTYTPMEDNNWGNGMQVDGIPDVTLEASFVKANADYFDSVGTKVLMGRGIGVQDTATAPPVVVVNQAFVKDFFKNQNPIGRRMGEAGSASDYEIVGVVADTVYQSVRWKDHRMYFVPMMQRPVVDSIPVDRDVSLYAGAMVIETAHPMGNMEELTQKTLAGINPNLTVVDFQTFSQQIAGCFVQERMIARLTQLFGVLALLLATIGLYGVTAYTVARRTAEIGIRMALGAERLGVVGMVMRGAIMQTLAGLAIGIPAALGGIHFVRSELYEISGADATVMGGAMVTLTIAACVAGILPARRAASIDPVTALRTE